MLVVKNLKKNFNKNKVLDGIDLSIEKGERIAIIGPSGCGKSTFLRCINLLEKPDSGNLLFNNVDITKLDKDLHLYREKIGMVFQQFNLFNNLTVLENIILAPINLKLMNERNAKKEAIKLLKKIGLESKKDNYPNELSGGQKQRVAIIRTLIMKPDIILFDEPTSALDPEMVDEVLELIKEIANLGMTMIIVSHEMDFVKNIATKVVFINEGKIVESGSVEEIFNRPKNERLKEFIKNIK